MACYEIQNCETPNGLTWFTVITTPNSIVMGPGDVFKPFPAITQSGYLGNCWTVVFPAPEPCVGATPVSSVTIYEGGCAECALPQPRCYLLEPCNPEVLPIIVNNDLQIYLNTVINVCIEEEPGVQICNCYTVKESQTCSGAISIPNPTSSFDSCNTCDYCYCPPGYEKVGDICQQIINSPATPSSTIYSVGPGSIDPAYGSNGTNFYPNVTNLPFPITEAGSQFVDASSSVLTPVNINTPGTVWSGPASSRLNTLGVWSTAPGGAPLNEWIGFTECVNISETKTYCIGLAADNMIRFKIDGTIVMQATNVSLFNFNYWHVFEITLTQGFHVIQIEGLNTGGPAAFGAEIYDATSAQLQSITSAVQLQTVTIFSTYDKLQSGVAVFDVGENSGYTCPVGSTFNNCESGPTCSIINTLPYVDCPPTFKVIDCAGVQPDFITNTDLTAYVNNNYYKVCIGEPAPPLLLNVNPDQPYAYTLTDCKSLVDPICTTENFYAYLNTYVTLFGYPGSCFLVTANPPGEICPNPIIVDVDTNTPCDCDTPPDPAWQDGCYCVKVEVAETATGQPFTGVFGDAFASCEACQRICYDLTDCKGVADPIKVTGVDLADCVGGVVKIRGCEDICWTVTLSENCDGCTSEVQVIECFPAGTLPTPCDACSPPPVPVEPTVSLRVRPVEPGYNTPACSPEYYDKVSCTFAEQVYNQMLAARYGLHVCCEEDLDKWDIKKELLDLQSIKNPNLP